MPDDKTRAPSIDALIDERTTAARKDATRNEEPRGLIGAFDYKPFKIYLRDEPRPFALGGTEPVLYGLTSFVPIGDDGTVTLSAEALRDLLHRVYRDGWRFGHIVAGGGEP